MLIVSLIRTITPGLKGLMGRWHQSLELNLPCPSSKSLVLKLSCPWELPKEIFKKSAVSGCGQGCSLSIPILISPQVTRYAAALEICHSECCLKTQPQHNGHTQVKWERGKGLLKHLVLYYFIFVVLSFEMFLFSNNIH